MIIKIAFYRGHGRLRDRAIRWWTRSPYSHVELVLPNNGGWIGIYPPDSPRVRLRAYNDSYKRNEWDFINLSVTREQVEAILDFYDKTKGQGYDWVGMVLSHVTPFKIKKTNKWYCSEWVAYALDVSGIISGLSTELYRRNKMPPNVLYNIVLRQVQSYSWSFDTIEDMLQSAATIEKINRVE